MTATETTTAPTPGDGSPGPRRRPALLAAAAAVAVVAVAGGSFALGQRAGQDPAAPATDEQGEGGQGAGAQEADEQGADEPGADQQDAAEDGAADADAAGPAAPLTWAPPELEDPEVVEISEDDTDLKLDQDLDYELVMPEEPLTRGLSVYGGRNVVMVGGAIQLEEGDGSRALYLRDQTGTVHIEGLSMGGAALNEGINLDQREGAVVQLQNIRVEEIDGSNGGHHADLLQVWAGPRQLLVDGFSGTTGYQGFFLLPQQFGDQPEPEVFDLRRVDVTGAEDGSAYMLWRDDADWPLETQDVWVSPSDRDPEDRREFLWDREGEDSWADVEVGTPPEGPFVPEALAGTGYTSPGYAGTP